MDTYQDSYRPGGSMPGDRDCEARWSLIESYLPASGMVLDVGSNLGYFGIRSTLERPDLAVLSIESDPLIADRQAGLIDANSAERVLLLQGHLTAAACQAWADTCDAVAATLLLAVVHWFDDPAGVVAALSSMSGRLIIEVPHPDDSGACGQEKLQLWADPIAWFSEVTGREVSLIGNMDRHTSDVPSYVLVIDGPVTRRPSLAYWGWAEDASRGDYRIHQDHNQTHLWVRGEERDYEPGLNLVNLMKLGALRRPTGAILREQFDGALSAAPRHQDPLPHNCLWTPRGLVLVDDEPRDALTTAADGRRAFSANLARWVEGETVSGEVEIRSLTRLQRWQRSRWGRAVSKRIPLRLRRLLRSAVRAVSK